METERRGPLLILCSDFVVEFIPLCCDLLLVLALTDTNDSDTGTGTDTDTVAKMM